jgi:hypothetical protein
MKLWRIPAFVLLTAIGLSAQTFRGTISLSLQELQAQTLGSLSGWSNFDDLQS